MARQKGTSNLSASLEVLAGAPLDARSLVNTESDLTVTSNFPYPYVGMTVTTKDTGDKYTLMALPVSQSANWKKDSVPSITIDDAMSSSSENPVQNKVITGALAGKADLVDGKIPAAQLPSYVDDVVEGYLYEGDFYEDAEHTQQITPESSKIYLDLPNNMTYRWDGISAYVAIGGGGVALGETSSTAYRGDRGKEAYDIAQTVGDVANLQTTDKTTVVDAINEARDFDENSNRPQKGITPISDILTPLPSVKPRVQKYSTEEQVIGQWINGKPLYQKTIACLFGTITTEGTYVGNQTPLNISNVDTIFVKESFVKITSWDVVCTVDTAWGGANDTSVLHTTIKPSTGVIEVGSSRTALSGCTAYVTVCYTKVSD